MITLERKLELPIFRGSQERKVSESMRWVMKNIEKRRWTNRELEEKFGRRTVAEILNEGHTCYMNPCADYTFLVTELLKENGFDLTLVVEELKLPKKTYSELHFALELFVDDKLHFVDYVTLDEIKFKKGKFVDRFEGEYKLNEIKIEASRLDPFECPLKSLGINSLEDIPKVFEHYSFEPHLKQLKKDNTPETYRRFLRERSLD